MTWRLFAVVVVLSAWEACGAQGLVNLLEPQLGSGAPTIQYSWELFDRDASTYRALRHYLTYKVHEPYSIQPTAYRIVIAAHLPPTKYPSSWKVEGTMPSSRQWITLDEVNDAVFSKGVYEGVLNQQINLGSVAVRFDRRTVKIAEVELLGPREFLDAYWPYGKYPCSQRHAVVTPKRGPKIIFSRSKEPISPVKLREVFKAADAGTKVQFKFGEGTTRAIIGAVLPEKPLVREVSILAWNLRRSVKRLQLQGSFCDGGHCNKYGSAGWVRLAAMKTLRQYDSPRLFIENPREYKAYRLKLIYSDDPSNSSFYMRGLSFLGCTV